MRIKNIFGEVLDVLIEGNQESDEIIIFVHGFGTDKNEGFSSFLDASKYFAKDYLVIRFDLSGYGASEGKDSEFQFQKAAGDLDSVLRFARKNYPEKKINIFAHSLGTFVVALLSPNGINKVVLTSSANSNPDFIVKKLQERILSKGGSVDEQGTSVYIRGSGAVQSIGKDFWRTLKNFEPLEYFEDLGKKTQLIMFKPLQDEVLDNEYFEEYKTLKHVQYVEINGDHNFKKPEDRTNLFTKIKEFLAAS